MKRAFIFGAIVLIPGLLIAGENDSNKHKDKSKKVTICHNGKNLTIAENALDAHLKHGDSIGPCQTEATVYVWEKGEGDVREYLYYPNLGIYYSVGSKKYYMQLDGKWKELAELSSAIKNNLGDAVTLKMRTNEPYTYHSEVLKTYPGKGVVTTKTTTTTTPNTADTSPSHTTSTTTSTKTTTTTVTTKTTSDGVTTQTSQTTVESSDGSAAEQALYTYFPDAAIYYNQTKKVYFYMQDGKWQSGPTLPQAIVIDKMESVEVTLNTDTPYIEHEIIAKKYPKGWSKKNEKDDKHK